MPNPRINFRPAAIIAFNVLWWFALSVSASESEIDALLNREAIKDMLTQYSYRWDGKDSAGFADLFTEDGVMERWVNGEKDAAATVNGKNAILNYAKNSHEGRLADRLSRHHFSGIVFIELSETNAITENMALITHQTENDSTAFIVSSGFYLNSWRKTENGWLISKRVLKTDKFEK